MAVESGNGKGVTYVVDISSQFIFSSSELSVSNAVLESYRDIYVEALGNEINHR